MFNALRYFEMPSLVEKIVGGDPLNKGSVNSGVPGGEAATRAPPQILLKKTFNVIFSNYARKDNNKIT